MSHESRSGKSDTPAPRKAASSSKPAAARLYEVGEEVAAGERCAHRCCPEKPHHTLQTHKSGTLNAGCDDANDGKNLARRRFTSTAHCEYQRSMRFIQRNRRTAPVGAPLAGEDSAAWIEPAVRSAHDRNTAAERRK
jgi:hypothetical protein